MNSNVGAGPFSRIQSIYRKRGILGLLVRRDLKVRYADSALGYIWSVLDPLLLGMVFWFVFTNIFERGVGEQPYIVFLLSAMLPFNWFTAAVGDSARALRKERLVRTTSLPREIWVLRLVIAKGAEFLFSIPVVAMFALIYSKSLTINVLYFPIAVIIQFILLLGLGLIIAPVVVLVRDVDRVVRIVLRFLFYATPVIYGLNDVYERVSGPIQLLYKFNPMTGIVSLYRSAFFPDQLDWSAVAISAGVSLAILVIGWFVFAKLERSVLKEI